ALARERGQRNGARRDLALHVQRAPAPDLAFPQLAGPGVERPLRPIGEHGVRVREEKEPRPAAAGNAGDEVRALRHADVQLARDPVRLEVVPEQLRRLRLVPGWVDGVDPDQPLKEVRDLLAKGQRPLPSTSTYGRRSSPPAKNRRYACSTSLRLAGPSVSSQLRIGGAELETRSHRAAGVSSRSHSPLSKRSSNASPRRPRTCSRPLHSVAFSPGGSGRPSSLPR